MPVRKLMIRIGRRAAPPTMRVTDGGKSFMNPESGLGYERVMLGTKGKRFAKWTRDRHTGR
jgi:hypothetical protein